MDPSSPTRSWTECRQDNLFSSNQLNGHSNDLDTVLSVKKQLAERRDDAGSASPEVDSLLDNPVDNDHERKETEYETQVGNEEESHEALLQRYRQLQEDVEVLASHMENQERSHKRERKEAEDERLALLQKNAAFERELDGLRVERDALFKQSTRMAAQRAEDERQSSDVRETHDELLRALAQQQQQTALLEKVASSASQDRIEARKSLDKAQMHCRRLEEELSSAHAQVLHLQNERDTLKAALDATVSGAADFETRQLQVQDEVIRSLRADLMQMEFELKTLSVDKATLQEHVEKLQQRLTTSECNDYEVVPLGNNTTHDTMAKRKGQKKRTTIRPVKSTKEGTNSRGSDLFNHLMELPNTVNEPPECANATIWLSPSTRYFSSSQNDEGPNQRRSFRERIAPPGLSSLVVKTVHLLVFKQGLGHRRVAHIGQIGVPEQPHDIREKHLHRSRHKAEIQDLGRYPDSPIGFRDRPPIIAQFVWNIFVKTDDKKTGRNVGAKPNWSNASRFMTAEVATPDTLEPKNPYQTWSTGEMRNPPRNVKMALRFPLSIANMSAEEEAPEIVSEFPAPPKFFALYADGVESGPAPPEPMEPTYHMFGSPYSTQDVVPDLLPQPDRKLYAQGDDPVDYKAEMKKINRSLLANFVELVDILIKKPAMFNEKLDDVELLFLNMHNLINAFRPHQARETVIQMLKTQVQERRDAARDIRRTIDESRQAVERVHGELHESTDDAVAADGVSPVGTDEDVKMESVDGPGAAGNGGDQAKSSGAT
ncbi:Mediator of RNA polymerase II transcription subunit, partial [Phytophthora palmivora]